MPQPDEYERKGESPRFEERQMFTLWAYVLIAVAAAGAATALLAARMEPSGRVALGAYLLIVALAANLFAMTTLVTGDTLCVTFGWAFPLYRRVIRIADITRAEAVTYSPLGEYGGWGIRGMGKNTALNASGNRGVRLTLRDGRRVLIGSQRPDALRYALWAAT